MNRIAGRKALFEKARWLTADPPRLKAVLDTVPVPDSVIQFLAGLELLNGVPFNYLVADEALLPAESIRFFQIDPNWIYALIEGAAGIGCTTSTDLAHDALMRPALHQAAAGAALQIRAHPDREAITSAATSGLLLRSAVVSGWPGLEIVAYDAQNNVLPVIRMDHLSPGILFFWAAGIIAQVEIKEPPEGMHFGVDIAGGKMLRFITVPSTAPANTQPGMEIANSSQPIPQRGNNVIAIDPLASSIKTALQTFQANNQQDGSARPFTAAEFALQMVEGTQAVLFGNQPGVQR